MFISFKAEVRALRNKNNKYKSLLLAANKRLNEQKRIIAEKSKTIDTLNRLSDGNFGGC